MTSRGNQTGGDGKDGFEALDGSKSDRIEGRNGDGFGPASEYIDARQCEGAGDLAQECGFLVAGLDESERYRRVPELDGDAGEAGAGADIGESGFHHRGNRGHRGTQWKQNTGGEEAFAEVAGDDCFGITDGGQIHARVPAKEYIDVRRYMFEVSGRQLSVARVIQKWGK